MSKEHTKTPVAQVEAQDERNLVRPYDGKSFCVTGVFSVARREVVAFFERHGCILEKRVTKNTAFIVVGEDPGSYLMAAKSRGVKIVLERDFNLAI